jgi:ribonuclease HI
MGWERFRFKGGKVYARVDDSGELVVDGGLVEIRYRPTDPKSYRAAASKLRPLDSGEPVSSGPPKASLTRRDRRRRVDAPVAGLPVGAVAAYTDGASGGNPGPAGWGVVLRFGEHVRELSGYLGPAQTHNIAELWAIKEALLAVTDRSRPICVYTDSTYAMGVLSDGWKATANQELVAEIREITGRFSDLHFVKVSGHRSGPDNERADALAHEAIPDVP